MTMDGRESSRMNSSDPPGMIVGPNSSYPNSSMGFPSSGGLMPGMRLSFNPMSASGPKPMDGPSSFYHGDNNAGSLRQCGILSMNEPPKKKRGRPRKYGPDGSMALALCPISSSPGYLNSNGSPMSEPTASKKRGRPPGTGRKQQLDALGSAGIAFTPHVITVKAGEDVASKILAFSQQGPRTVCILSANGAVCNVTLRQPATSGGTVSYEGRFEIISLTGSFLLTETGGTRSRSGGLSVALVGSEGRVLGGGVAGGLMAATPVQVVMGSFIAEGKKPKPEQKREPSSAPPPQQQPPQPQPQSQPQPQPQPQMLGFGAPSAASPPSQGTSSESDDDDDDDDGDDSGSPGIDMSGAGATYNSGQQGHNPMPAYNSVGGWPHSANHFTRHDSDMMHN